MTKARPKRDSYHHGDLRTALIEAGNTELAELGIEGFTLRGCARRIGVSHSAPASFFKDVRSFFSELAAGAYERLAAELTTAVTAAGSNPVEQLVAIGCGYARFAAAHPNHFRLMFRVEMLDKNQEHLKTASAAALGIPSGAIGRLRDVPDAMQSPCAAEVIAVWSIAHGFADLLIAGQLQPGGFESADAAIDAILPNMIRRQFGAATP
jgi:AcrR family transcriptional regulator